MAQSVTRARRLIPEMLADLDNELTSLAREAIHELYDLFRNLDRRIAIFDKKINVVFFQSDGKTLKRAHRVSARAMPASAASLMATARRLGVARREVLAMRGRCDMVKTATGEFGIMRAPENL